MRAGHRVAEERQRLGLSQDELARRVTKLGYPITQTGIDKIEKRDTERPKSLKELALALAVNEEWLLTGKEPKHPTTDRRVEQLMHELRQLDPDEQENLFRQFRALLAVAQEKSRQKT
jgi:transcriptional regulator with XRE-family HTH domain